MILDKPFQANIPAVKTDTALYENSMEMDPPTRQLQAPFGNGEGKSAPIILLSKPQKGTPKVPFSHSKNNPSSVQRRPPGHLPTVKHWLPEREAWGHDDCTKPWNLELGY